MANQRYDDGFFYSERHRLLEPARLRSDGQIFRLPAAIARGSALGCGLDETTERALGKLAARHATAARAHMAFYQSSLEATALVPAHELVQAAVQIEWLWYSTPFKSFYRDHLAHVLKVTTMALHALEDPHGLLAPLAKAGECPGKTLGRWMAAGKVGSSVLRQAALRLGVSRAQLADPDFWYDCLRETLRIAGLLHDMAYPAMLGGYVRRATGAADPLFPYQADHSQAAAKILETIDGTLVAAVFDADRSVDLRRYPIQPILELVLAKSHSLQAGANLLQYRRVADRAWRLSPSEAFAIEWAARAATLHDFDKLWEYAPGRKKEGQSELTDWLKSADHLEAIRPAFTRDPASYLLAFADQLQDFGRLHYQRTPFKAGSKSTGRTNAANLEICYPCRSVELQSVQRSAKLVWRFGPYRKPFGVPKAQEEIDSKRKKKDAELVFGANGWLDHSGLYDEVVVG